MFTAKDAEKALVELEALKGRERAQLIERMLRLETNHFKSQQFAITGSAGMEEGHWPNLKPGTYSTISMNDNHPDKVSVLKRVFIKWNNILDFCLYMSDYIDRHDGNFARWNTTDMVRQDEYRKSVMSVKPRFIV